MIITIIGNVDDKNVIDSMARDLEENVRAICLTERTEATGEDDLLKECTNTMRKIDKSDILIVTEIYYNRRIASLISYAQYTKKLVIHARNFYQARPFLWGVRNE